MQITNSDLHRYGWDHLIGAIVRPQRKNYRDQLLEQTIKINEVTYSRTDRIVEHNEKLITLTIYDPPQKSQWIILYLHGNGGSRLESKVLMKYLPSDFSLGCFDFMGCGINDQMETISLGYREAEQTESVVQKLKQCGYRVITWGRSMGAATSLLHGKSHMIVADSSYTTFKSSCLELVKNNLQIEGKVQEFVTNCIFPCVFMKMKGDVKEKAKYDLNLLNVEQAIGRINPSIPIVFITGDQDQIVHKKHSQKLYKMYPSKKKYLQIVRGGTHNSDRPPETYKNVMSILVKQAKDYDSNTIRIFSSTFINLESSNLIKNN